MKNIKELKLKPCPFCGGKAIINRMDETMNGTVY